MTIADSLRATSWIASAMDVTPDTRTRVVRLEDALLAVEAAAKQRDEYVDLLGAIWLYIKWRYVTKQLTTEQKTLFADAVDAWSARMNDVEDWQPVAERWWLE